MIGLYSQLCICRGEYLCMVTMAIEVKMLFMVITTLQVEGPSPPDVRLLHQRMCTKQPSVKHILYSKH